MIVRMEEVKVTTTKLPAISDIELISQVCNVPQLQLAVISPFLRVNLYHEMTLRFSVRMEA